MEESVRRRPPRSSAEITENKDFITTQVEDDRMQFAMVSLDYETRFQFEIVTPTGAAVFCQISKEEARRLRDALSWSLD